jgi:hypothetical protein
VTVGCKSGRSRQLWGRFRAVFDGFAFGASSLIVLWTMKYAAM